MLPRILHIEITNPSLLSLSISLFFTAYKNRGTDRSNVSHVPFAIRGIRLHPRREGIHLRIRRSLESHPRLRRDFRSRLQSRSTPSREHGLHQKRRPLSGSSPTFRWQHLLNLHLLEQQSYVLDKDGASSKRFHERENPRSRHETEEDGHLGHGQWKRPLLPVRRRSGRLQMGRREQSFRSKVFQEGVHERRVQPRHSRCCRLREGKHESARVEFP